MADLPPGTATLTITMWGRPVGVVIDGVGYAGRRQIAEWQAPR